MRRLVQELAKLYPQRGALAGVIYQGGVYPLERARYGEGYVIWPSKSLAKVSVEGDYVVAPTTENPTKLEEALELKVEKLTIKYIHLYQQEYAIFSGVVAYQPPPEREKDYVILSAGDLLAVFTAKWVEGKEEEYRYPAAPSWMYAKAKLAKAANPHLWVGVDDYKRRYYFIRVKQLLKISIQCLKIPEAKPMVKITVGKAEVEEREEDARISALIEEIQSA